MFQRKKEKKNLSKKIIRFKRRGSLKNPNYDIILVFRGQKTNTGKIIEKLGHYDPSSTDRSFYINGDRLAFWVERGAVIHKTVKKYIIKFLVYDDYYG